jgi:hypothetical protein
VAQEKHTQQGGFTVEDEIKRDAALAEYRADPVRLAATAAKTQATIQRKKKFADALKEVLDEIDVNSGCRRWKKVARSVVKAAEEGDMEAVRIIADRTDGKAVPSEEELEASGIKVIFAVVKLPPPARAFLYLIAAGALSWMYPCR